MSDAVRRNRGPFPDEQTALREVHVQQSAESLARASIEDAGIKFGVSRSLGQMAAALPENHPWREDIGSLDHLSRYATAHRYPLESGRLAEPPVRDELIADLEQIKRLAARARAFLKLAPHRDPGKGER